MDRHPSTPTSDNAQRTATHTVTDVWCPGNATRYDLFLSRPASGPILLAWLNPGRSIPNAGRAIEVFDGNEYDAWYLEEKLDCSTADAAAILAWLGRMGFLVCQPDGYDVNGRFVGAGRSA